MTVTPSPQYKSQKTKKTSVDKPNNRFSRKKSKLTAKEYLKIDGNSYKTLEIISLGSVIFLETWLIKPRSRQRATDSIPTYFISSKNKIDTIEYFPFEEISCSNIQIHATNLWNQKKATTCSSPAIFEFFASSQFPSKMRARGSRYFRAQWTRLSVSRVEPRFSCWLRKVLFHRK